MHLPRSSTRLAAAIVLFASLAGAENRIDVVRPDAPTLASYGAHSIGVRTVRVVHQNQIDVLALEAATEGDGELPRYDRPLILEIWHPATPSGKPTPYDVYLRDGETRVQVHGRATRDAEPDLSAAPYPLVLISHGYPGNRFLLSHLAENLASKGYVVASIDHTDSTYRTAAAFASTLVNRSLDQLFVLDEMTRMAALESSFLYRLLDGEKTGLIGYSMGGYGAIITAGGGVTQKAVDEGAARGTMAIHRAGSQDHEQRFSDRLKAVVAFAPWGMKAGIWDSAGLAGIRVPTLFVAGSVDDVSGYDDGVRAIFQQAVHIDRALLTFDNANHNAGAPMPAPEESLVARDGARPSFYHYADPVWDSVRMNNIAQHFVSAFFGKHLKGEPEMDAYLDLVPSAADGVWSVNDDGSFENEHSYWKGFQNRTAAGLHWEKLPASQ